MRLVGWHDRQGNSRPARRRPARALALAALLAVASGCGGPVESPVQSANRPHGLPLYGAVKQAGSDWKAARFQRDALPGLIVAASQKFNRENIAAHFGDVALDPQRLLVAETTRVRVYFVGEASGYRNAVGVNLSGVGIQEGEPKLLIPDETCRLKLYDAAAQVAGDPPRLSMEPFGERTEEFPLHPGDFVDLGRIPAGTRLNFFMVSQEEDRVYTPMPEANPDGIPHMVALAVDDSPYMVISFEDMYQGGDRDFSDCVLAVEMSRYNIQALLGRIDPWRRAKQVGLLAAIIAAAAGGPLGYLAWRTYRRLKRVRAACLRARALLDASDPDGALKEIAGIHREYGNDVTPEFTAVEIDVCTRLSDVGGLARIYEACGSAFHDREDASLLVGEARLAEGHTSAYGEVRERWRNRESHPGAWLGLDADALIFDGKGNQAATLLAHCRFDGPEDRHRLARLAWLTGRGDPGKALALADAALRQNPDCPDVHRYRGRLLETLGAFDEARKAFEQSLRLAPRNPLLRDALAEFLLRRGEYGAALAIWTKALEHNATGALWLKALFWRRVARPVPLELDKLHVPEDELEPLVRFLAELPPSRFWDDAGFDRIADERPDLASRQEVFWLRLSQALKTHREPEALTLVNLNRFGARSWNAELERALPRMLTWRRLAFMDPSLPRAAVELPHPRHVFFETLDAWTLGAGPVPEAFQRLLRSESAFAAAYLAAGWYEAGLMLLPAAAFQGDWPEWFLRDVFEAVRACRGEEKARQFLNQHQRPRG